MNRPTALLLVATLAFTAGCSGGAPPGSPSRPGEGIDLAVSRVARAAGSADRAVAAATSINAFGFDLLRSAAPAASNAVLSPASVAIALSMARAGARGATAEQMDRVLRDLGSDGSADAVNALDQALAARNATFKDGDGHDLTVTLRIANAPFAQRGVAWKQAYLDALAGRFGAGLRLVDYARDSTSARGLINGWVADQTERRITELLGPGVVDNQTRLVLVNAIYMKAPWANPFDAGQTKPGSFARADGSQIQVPMMTLQRPLQYASGDGWRAVELPYLGSSLAMDVIVPDELAAFEKRLDGDAFAAIISGFKPTQVDLALPRFTTESKVDLVASLRSLGMPLAFEPGAADFSGMTDAEKLFIAAVVHQANIDVDEKGTEASAATAVVMDVTAAPAAAVELHVDRPFLFALRDVPTGSILFLGRVVDPSAGR